MPTQILSTRLIEQISKLFSQKATGELVVASTREKWSLYFFFGRFLYATGGSDRVRRWQRIVKQYNPILSQSRATQAYNLEAWEYKLLRLALSRNQIKLPQVEAIVSNGAIEVLFNIISSGNFTIRWQANPAINNPICLIPFQQRIFTPVKNLLLRQQQLNIPSAFQPHLSPVTHQPNSADIPAEFSLYLKGQHSFWDIATITRKSIVDVYSVLDPVYRKGALQLKTLADANAPLARTNKNTSVKVIKPEAKKALIACIDDSLVLCKELEKILVPAGYQVLKINNPIAEMLTLVKKKPQLILLDIMMPDIDGYNLCKMLRKTPGFRNTPIIILTSSTQAIDRARALAAGAKDFLSKPPKADVVLGNVKKYLPV